MAKVITEIDIRSQLNSGITAAPYTKQRSGFYYDHELNNPLTRVTLHANKKYNWDTTNIEGPWESVCDPDLDDKGSEWPYDTFPIATSIFAEDFSFDIANTFSNFGGDAIGDLWNSQQAMSPYAKMVGDALQTISEKTSAWSNNKEAETGGRVKWADTLASVTSFMAKAAEERSHYLSRALHVKGTQFSYYSGTGISFNNMSMKFTLLSDYDENGTFKSVIYKLLNNDGWPLLAYVIGDYIDVKEIGKGEVKEFISKWASWQLPPGGFRANLQDVDVVNEGTLKLRFGPYFSIPNLIISGCSISMSKEMMRNPTAELTGEPKIVPMACDVNLQFKPAANFSKKTLEKVLMGGVSASSEFISEVPSPKYLDTVVNKMGFKDV